MRLLDGLTRIIEAPWSPEQCFLPARRSPELSGNSPEAYRQSFVNPQTERLEHILASENLTTISRWSRLYEFTVPAPHHSPMVSGGNILHLSDIHFIKGDPRPIHEMQQLIRYLQFNQIALDMIVLTGDVITKMPDDLCHAALRSLAQLAELTKQSLFVYGNHDYHGKVPEYISKQLMQVGFVNLTGDQIECPLGRGYATLSGIDDSYFGSPRAPKSLAGNDLNITLVHNLDAIRKNFPSEIDLILSGHTHWGEIKLPFSNMSGPMNGVWWMNKWGYADNLNKHTKHWDQLSDRTLSFVHPGLARYYAPRMFAHSPGFVLLNFTDPQEISKEANQVSKYRRIYNKTA